MTTGEWVTGIVTILVALWGVWQRRGKITARKAIGALGKAVDWLKAATEGDGTPEVAKGLTNKIRANLEVEGSAVIKAHESALAKAGANVTAILGPAIARLARSGGGDGA